MLAAISQSSEASGLGPDNFAAILHYSLAWGLGASPEKQQEVHRYAFWHRTAEDLLKKRF